MRFVEPLEDRALFSAAISNPATGYWDGLGADPQHTAIATAAAQPLQAIHWSTPVDLHPQFINGELIVHYGSPVITAGNTVIVPVKTGSTNWFALEAFDGATGKLKWRVNSNYGLPSGSDIQGFSPAISADGRLYFAGAAGAVYWLDNLDASGKHLVYRDFFYGLAAYKADPVAYTRAVSIDTPITADRAGNVYFGYEVNGSTPLGLASGIARVSSSGKGTYVSAAVASGNAADTMVPHNAAPTLSNDGKTLYVAIGTDAGWFAPIDAPAYLVALNSTTLKTVGRHALIDPTGGYANVLAAGSSAAPAVGPDGDVYFGVLENNLGANDGRGWMLHFSADLKTEKIPGAFGWDDTASIVPASMIKSYHGTSKYLLLTKYNDYADFDGSGINKVAVLDPNASMIDPVSGATVMKTVETVAGVTPDPKWVAAHPGAVKEWCINTAAVDPKTDSVFVNSEDGVLYRWNLGTGKLDQSVRLTQGLGESYTPTEVGPDGTVYAIQDGRLFAVGAKK